MADLSMHVCNELFWIVAGTIFEDALDVSDGSRLSGEVALKNDEVRHVIRNDLAKPSAYPQRVGAIRRGNLQRYGHRELRLDQ